MQPDTRNYFMSIKIKASVSFTPQLLCAVFSISATTIFLVPLG